MIFSFHNVLYYWKLPEDTKTIFLKLKHFIVAFKHPSCCIGASNGIPLIRRWNPLAMPSHLYVNAVIKGHHKKQ